MDIVLLSELITKLQEIKNTYGDLIVCNENYCSDAKKYISNLYIHVKEVDPNELQLKDSGNCDSNITACVITEHQR